MGRHPLAGSVTVSEAETSSQTGERRGTWVRSREGAWQSGRAWGSAVWLAGAIRAANSASVETVAAEAISAASWGSEGGAGGGGALFGGTGALSRGRTGLGAVVTGGEEGGGLQASISTMGMVTPAMQ